MTRQPPLDPAVAETRVAVRRALAALATESVAASTAESAADHAAERAGERVPAPDAANGAGRAAPLVLVALSGGADSLALAAATAFEAPRAGLRAGAVVVDHGLQAGSAEVAAGAAGQARELGLDPALVRRVEVAADHSDGPEAAAREARYAALEAARAELGAVAVLTGHTRDDQAEQVLLALARGSGTRAVAGIPPRRGAILRPLLGVARATTERACAAQGLEPWADPHNADPAFARVRVRERLLPALERELGPGVAAALARTAELAREDADALDALAEERLRGILDSADDAAAGPAADPSADPADAGAAPDPLALSLPVAPLAEMPPALRGRAIRLLAARRFGARLGREHTLAVAALVTDWRGQGPVFVPGLRVSRRGGALILEPQVGSPRGTGTDTVTS